MVDNTKDKDEIHRDYLARTESSTDNRPALKLEDKVYRVNIHDEKRIICYKIGIKEWSDEKENQLIEFIKHNKLDTKCCIFMKRGMVEGLSMVQAYESYMDVLRKPHPEIFFKYNQDVYEARKRLSENLNNTKGDKSKYPFHFIDDPNPDKWIDHAVKYL